MSTNKERLFSLFPKSFQPKPVRQKSYERAVNGDLRMLGTESRRCLVLALALPGTQQELNKLCINEYENDMVLVTHLHAG